MYSDVSDKLLDGVVFQVTVAAVHLERLVADLAGENVTHWLESDKGVRPRPGTRNSR